ncbi:MAG: T9SS type A sorting domain-containing protein [Candidatus Coatesbacteria bacterium]|nr:T9SS type A sorting domain-containing protein [Candidatus Coatesbacteria bacterium]
MKALILFGFLLPGLLFAWERTYGTTEFNEYATCLTQTEDSGYIVLGNIWTNETPGKIWLVKTDKYGYMEWEKKFDYNGYNYRGINLKRTSDGYIIIGHTSNGAYYDIYILKLDNNAEKIWDKTLYKDKGELGVNIFPMENEYIIAGCTSSIGAGEYDIYLARIDSIGNLIWEKTYGDEHSNINHSTKRTNDNCFIISGATDYGSNNWDTNIIKVDINGEKIFDKRYGGNIWDRCYDICQLKDSSYVATGNSDNSFWVLKLDVSGDKLWEKFYKEEGEGKVVTQADDGNIIIGGSIWKSSNPSNLYILCVDLNGEVLWEKEFGDSNTKESPFCIDFISDGYILGGDKSQGECTETITDLYLLKVDKQGRSGFSSYVSAKSLPSPSLSISPNPFSNRLSLSLPSSGAIYSLTGQLIMKMDKGKHELDTSKWKQGVYIVKSGMESKRIVKVK